MTPLRHNITVAEFFERHFRPERLARLSPKMVHKYEGAVRRFRDVLNATPTLADLGDEQIRQVAAWVLKFGRSRDRAHCYWKCLRTIARHAQTLGYRTGELRNYGRKPLSFESSAPLPSVAPQRHRGVRDRTLQRIATAAVRLSTGAKLDDVAKELSVSHNTVLRWQREHADVWEYAYHVGSRGLAFQVWGLLALPK